VSWWLVGRNLLLAGVLTAAYLAGKSSGPWWRAVRDWVARRKGEFLVPAVFAVMALLILQLYQKTNLLQLQLSQPPLLRAGETVPPFDATFLPDRREGRVSFAGEGSTFLFVFSPHCPHCRRALARLNEMAGAAPAGVRLLGVTLGTPEGTERYLREQPARFPVCAPKDLEAVRESYRLFTFPQVIEVGRGGKVLAVGRGAPRGAD
jgi:thiol-disulfide isomerase/thioredoxin